MATPVQRAFAHDELERALKEQSFGITSFEIVSTTPLKAAASVVLLEGPTVLVSLSNRGFQVHPDLDAEAVFETIEQLLQSVSPQYDAARRSALITKLESIQATPEPA
ncbi:hypothetical protein DICSQDRAFT_70216 [Dichomitus squalens LYAD-421 SS1]|uniref:GSKIP domain-containing protein n=2 Tax=Dichomitus squalens TaxID=114155 RepID=A0A4Q9Q4A4_9APHY|nr:uncharacterized protein DICSQDRAFT_70216 [Dichomitus squalens LYAD-421 SS1]EJF57081.1 hypothetical protein DICSQDRAFT_70216 [Dichomitus squalens LYAD-421 SS1]TBU61910.1 hypothetical protein BD310DRAFT_872821 [Dichomitus squalens]